MTIDVINPSDHAAFAASCSSGVWIFLAADTDGGGKSLRARAAHQAIVIGMCRGRERDTQKCSMRRGRVVDQG